MPRSVVPAVVALAALLSACVPSTNDVEAQLTRELPTVLGPAEFYDVEIEGLRAVSGRADRVTIVGERVAPEGTPVLDRIRLEVLGLQVDRKTRRIDRADRAQATVEILPRDLAAFVERQANVTDVSVVLDEPDQARVRLRGEIGGFPLPRAEVAGRLASVDGEVRFEVADVRAGGLSLGGAVARRLSDAVNPLVDLSDLPAGLRVTSLRVADGVLVVEADGTLTGVSLRRSGQTAR